MRKPLANALDIDLGGGLTDKVTPHAGVALLLETARRSGVIAAAERALPAKSSAQGLRQGEMVESLVLLSALGGDGPEDLDRLRRDQGLAALTGYVLPAASTARQWLDRFHDPAALADRPPQGSVIPVETAALAGLRAVVERSVLAYVTAVPPDRTVTLDVDAHVVERSKREALPTYTGERGYQPVLVSWAETGLVLADEFRDGNVPASVKIKEVVDTAAATLPARAAGWAIQVRKVGAAYEHAILDHWAGRGGRCAVSAEMRAQLRAAVVALPAEAWQAWTEERGARSAATGCGNGLTLPTCPAGSCSGRTSRPLGTWRCGCGRRKGGGAGMGHRSSTAPWSATTGRGRDRRSWHGSGARQARSSTSIGC